MASPFAFIEHPTDAPALIDAPTGRIWTQDELADAVRSSSDRLATGGRRLVFVLCSGDVASTVGYLSAITAGHAVALLDAAAPADLTQALVDRYQPSFIVRSPDDESDLHTPKIVKASDITPPAPSEELADVLSTS